MARLKGTRQLEVVPGATHLFEKPGALTTRHSAYQSRRSRDWLKFRCERQQELIIGGHTAPHGARIGFGALLLGYYDNGRLRYAGKVGTGYDDETLRTLGRKLAALKVKAAPFADAHAIRNKGSHGSRRNSSRRSDSPSGPKTASFGIRGISDSDRTSPHAPSFGSEREG